VAQDQLSRLGTLIAGLAPVLTTSKVRRAWSCLRSFAPGGDFVIGPDPRADGVFWLAGLGGRGMTCGLALGEALAASSSGAS
jgi:D-arginine dehydrogenase